MLRARLVAAREWRGKRGGREWKKTQQKKGNYYLEPAPPVRLQGLHPLATRTPCVGFGGMSSVDESESLTKLSPSGERPRRPQPSCGVARRSMGVPRDAARASTPPSSSEPLSSRLLGVPV